MKAPYQKLSIRGWPHALWAKPLKSSFLRLYLQGPTNLVPIERRDTVTFTGDTVTFTGYNGTKFVGINAKK